MAEIVKITEAEVLAALEESVNARPTPDDAQSVAEMASAMGVREGAVQKALKRLAAQGRLRVYRRASIRLDGQRSSTPVYAVLPAAPAKKAKR